MDLVIIFFAGFASIFCAGLQSRNVNHGNYGWAAFTAFLIAATQTTLWGTLFDNLTWLAALVFGASGALGIVSSMYVHQRFINKPRPTKSPTKPSETDQ